MSRRDAGSPVITMRIIVIDPPAGVRFAVQRGKDGLLARSGEERDVIAFEFPLRLGAPLPDGSPNMLGEFAQGTPSDRFIYLNSGTLAGQPGTQWTRRAKLKIASIPRDVVEQALSASGILEARVQGTMRDGGPICASVKPEAVVWRFVQVGG